VQVGDLVKHYDQLYAGLGLVLRVDHIDQHRNGIDFVYVQYGDVTDWIDIEDLEIVNASR